MVGSERDSLTVAVIGSGTMGAALSHTIATAGHACTLLTQDVRVMESINSTHCHPFFFGGLSLHPQVQSSNRFDSHIPRADLILMAVPSHAMRGVARSVSHLTHARQSVLSVTKGFEPATHSLMSQVLAEELDTAHIGTLSGPNITLDLVKNLPTALVIASNSPQMREHGERALATPTVKIKLSDDILSYEYASALKNIVALEIGIVTGLGLGDNFRALMLAEGMAEIVCLMARMGLQSDVFYTLAGLSDIFLTCSSHFARNYTIGVRLGEGSCLPELLGELETSGETAEGVESLLAGKWLTQQHRSQVPLLDAAHAFVYGESNLGADAFLSAMRMGSGN